jgi:hypothetical protein
MLVQLSGERRSPDVLAGFHDFDSDLTGLFTLTHPYDTEARTAGSTLNANNCSAMKIARNSLKPGTGRSDVNCADVLLKQIAIKIHAPNADRKRDGGPVIFACAHKCEFCNCGMIPRDRSDDN